MREYPTFVYRGGALALDQTAVMGVLNVTPDSFSDGGKYEAPAAAIDRALEMEREGAAILDIGGQSTRPGHTPVSDREEWARLEPVLTALRGRLTIPISVDTYYPYVAEQALQAGAAILNDVSGSLRNGFVPLAKRYGAGLVMMHGQDTGAADRSDSAGVAQSVGTAADCRFQVSDEDADRKVLADEAIASVRAYFADALALAVKHALPIEQVCLDIGVGFGKTRVGDLAVLARLPELLRDLPNVAVLCGASRKRVIGAACGNPPFEQRLPGTIALHTAAQLAGARILRAHDVKEAIQAAKVTDALIQTR